MSARITVQKIFLMEQIKELSCGINNNAQNLITSFHSQRSVSDGEVKVSAATAALQLSQLMSLPPLRPLAAPESLLLVALITKLLTSSRFAFSFISPPFIHYRFLLLLLKHITSPISLGFLPFPLH